MEDYLNGIDEDLWKCITVDIESSGSLQNIGYVASSPEVSNQAERKKRNVKKWLPELRGALPPIVYNYVHGCSTAKEIWATLNEKYQESEKTKKSYVKQCLLELGEFK